jgi:hypothetical protein
MTSYGQDGRGSIPGKGIKFFLFTASKPALGPIQSAIQKVLGSFPRGKAAEGWRWSLTSI